jgi:hypothetical protein
MVILIIIMASFLKTRRSSCKGPKGGHSPLLRELGTTPVEATEAAARTRAFLKVPTLNTCISDLVGQPSRMRPNTWTFGTVRLLGRFARASSKLAQYARVPPALPLTDLKQRYGFDSTHHLRYVLKRGVFIPKLHMLGTHCHNTARAFPRGPLKSYML